MNTKQLSLFAPSTRESSPPYATTASLTPEEAIRLALAHLRETVKDRPLFENPDAIRRYLILHLAPRLQEVFCVLFLDARHRLIAMEDMFFGTIDGCTVHLREIVRKALHHNASAVVFAHNHPSGVAEPSRADEAITRRAKEALGLVDVRLLDHFVVAGDDAISMAERGLL